MTVAEYINSNSPFRFVHADHNERIHEQVKNSPNDYEVIGVKILHGYIFIEVREIIKNENN